MAVLVEMKFIKRWDRWETGDTVRTNRANAGLLEAKGVAVRIRKAHDKRKPISNRHTVTKGD